ncbi:hypothetical protein ACRVEI_12595, partial [Pseudomonas aeruginosa]
MAAPTRLILGIFALRPATAIEYLEHRGFAITWNWHDVDAATHARALTVAQGSTPGRVRAFATPWSRTWSAAKRYEISSATCGRP